MILEYRLPNDAAGGPGQSAVIDTDTLSVEVVQLITDVVTLRAIARQLLTAMPVFPSSVSPQAAAAFVSAVASARSQSLRELRLLRLVS